MFPNLSGFADWCVYVWGGREKGWFHTSGVCACAAPFVQVTDTHARHLHKWSFARALTSHFRSTVPNRATAQLWAIAQELRNLDVVIKVLG